MVYGNKSRTIPPGSKERTGTEGETKQTSCSSALGATDLDGANHRDNRQEEDAYSLEIEGLPDPLRRAFFRPMQIIHNPREMQSFSEVLRTEGTRIVLIPTMGYFHEGHLSLMRIGRGLGECLVLSLFVNPAQFGQDEDFEDYPRDFDRDCRMAESVGVDVIFNPDVETIYPPGYQTYVTVEEVTRDLCGASRPIHFRGVATVVAKLFNIAKPHSAVFGQKDYQQLVTIRRMVEDLNLDVEIVAGPTFRETDGVAMSSRNTYLDPEERKAARSLSRSIREVEGLFAQGERRVDRLQSRGRECIEAEPLAGIDYIEIRDAASLNRIEVIEQEAVYALAVRFDKARLIDNCLLVP